MIKQFTHLKQGVLAGKTKRRVRKIPCEMQHGLDLLRLDYTKERNKRERGHSFGVKCHSTAKKKIALGLIVVASF